MASLTLDTDHATTRSRVNIEGTGFEIDTPVAIEVSHPLSDFFVSAVVIADGSGDFASDQLGFVLNDEGVWTVTADDGTNTAELTFRVSNAG